jgi:hypothetical protein
VEAYLLKKGISLDSIKTMSESEISEYTAIIGVMDEIESESLQKR